MRLVFFPEKTPKLRKSETQMQLFLTGFDSRQDGRDNRAEPFCDKPQLNTELAKNQTLHLTTHLVSVANARSS